MHKDLIQQIEAEIVSWGKLLDSQDEKLKITQKILREIHEGLLGESTQSAPISNNERVLYLNELKRCNEDVAAIFAAGVEMKRHQDSLKIQLDKLKNYNSLPGAQADPHTAGGLPCSLERS